MQKIELENINSKEIIPGYSVQFIHSENMTFAYWNIKAGSSLPEHFHPNEQVATMIE